jgi:GxxExxY protein
MPFFTCFADSLQAWRNFFCFGGDMENLEDAGKIILSAAIKVHSILGPGLLESAYQKCLSYELQNRGLKVLCEVLLPVKYESLLIDVGYRVDMIVEDCIIVENKAVEKLVPVHEAQLLTYLKLNDCRLGFLLNWNVTLMKDGIKRLANHL